MGRRIVEVAELYTARSMRAIGVVIAVLSALALSGQASQMKLGEVLVFTPASTSDAGAARTYVFQAIAAVAKDGTCTCGPETPGSLVLRRHRRLPEYHLVNPSSAGPLPDIDVLGMHYIKVRPDRRDAFETFVASTLHPAVGKLRPDLRLLSYKAVSGPQAGSYVTIFALTRESRDKCTGRAGSDSDDLRAAFEKVRPIAKDLLPYLVEGSALTDEKFAAAVYESRDWSDFVLIAAPK